MTNLNEEEKSKIIETVLEFLKQKNILSNKNEIE